ncbi:hypothetical protein TeGR_g8582 [Tetraparma gracilis]|uniref:UBC core domain-containing protein n=1 Tax=Tetraparma gracilis TaxID=2962635 RepID=A0ABQ6N5T9_9STRA|nr:hypothetical protein TeGR_g8582 [Tetraparma gracilis]
MSGLSSPAPSSLKSHHLSIEYKHLLSHSPSGVYLLPSPATPGLFVGVIFLRRGLYQNGIYKFTLQVPPSYNERGSHPVVTFTTPLLSPLVSDRGVLDMPAAFPEWDPSRHYLITALTYVKKLFYIKSFSLGPAVGGDLLGSSAASLSLPGFANPDALELHATDPAGYAAAVKESVQASQEAVYANRGEGDFQFVKQGGGGEHDLFRAFLLKELERQEEGKEGGGKVGAEGVLGCVKMASAKKL